MSDYFSLRIENNGVVDRAIQSGESTDDAFVPVSRDQFTLQPQELERLQALLTPERIEIYQQDVVPRERYVIAFGEGWDRVYLRLTDQEANTDETDELLSFFSEIEGREGEVQ